MLMLLAVVYTHHPFQAQLTSDQPCCCTLEVTALSCAVVTSVVSALPSSVPGVHSIR